MNGPSHLHTNNPGSGSGASVRLFCLPYAGGNTAVFHSWSETMLPGVEICPIKLPRSGRRLNEPLFTRMDPLVRFLVPVISSYPSIPFALFGHSLGALICFELARELRRQGRQEPQWLFLSGCDAPQKENTNMHIHNLPQEQFIDKLRDYGGTPEEIIESSMLMEYLLPSLRADFAIFETYEHRVDAPFSYPVSIFCGSDDTFVSKEGLNLWKEQTSSSCNFKIFPGDHFFLHSSQKALVQEISKELQIIMQQEA